MAEIKYSSLLEALFDRARDYTFPGAAVTEEVFFRTAIAYCLNSDGSNEEARRLRDKLAGTFESLDNTAGSLSAHIETIGKSTLVDNLQFQKKLGSAKRTALDAGANELTAPMLVEFLLTEPSRCVASCIKSPSKRAPDLSHIPGANEILASVDPEELLFIDPEEPDEEANRPRRKKAEPNPKDMYDLVAAVSRHRQTLKQQVLGQDHAINAFATGYFRHKMLELTGGERKRPAIFLFAGPPGVGKTLLAESIGRVLNMPCRRFDMSEYADKEAVVEFAGSDEVYKGAKSGNVTGFVMEHPKSILLFDEIEKAHLSVIHLFLQLLDNGMLRDAKTDREVSFRDTIVIMTTNAGRSLYEDNTVNLAGVSRKVLLKALEQDVNPVTGNPFFPAAICSRFATGNTVMFNHLGAHHLQKIIGDAMEKQAVRLRDTYGMEVTVEDSVSTALLYAEGAAVDARTASARGANFFDEELYELLRLAHGADTKAAALRKLTIRVDTEGASPAVQELFYPREVPRYLVFAEGKNARRVQKTAANCQIVTAVDADEAMAELERLDGQAVLLDFLCGADLTDKTTLNAEDMDSPGRAFFSMLQESRPDMPVYLLQPNDRHLTDEEIVSFDKLGIRGVLDPDSSDFEERIGGIAVAVHRQAGLMRLARQNKLLTYATAQELSKDGSEAEIRLFDMKLSTAVDAGDTGNILSAMSMPDVSMSDVIGAADAKASLMDFVGYLKNPKRYAGTGAKPPRGVILYGPPGTGKTMLAKALASEAGVTFLAAEGNQFLKKYVGEGQEAVHELFRTARKYAPSVVFVDEIDAIAVNRESTDSQATSATLTAFLTEMDGFNTVAGKPVFVLAATNYPVTGTGPKTLDAALMRRFDRRICVDLPDKEDRIRFLEMKISKNPALQISARQVENLAVRSAGMSLAALESVLELALRSVLREAELVVTDSVLEEAFETFTNGERKDWNAETLERVARHEAGHAFLCWQGGETPSYLTVVARGDHGGYMQHGDQDGKAIFTKAELLHRIRTSLGGRAAELVYYGAEDGVSTGASGDLQSATTVARRLICSYGMDHETGLAVITEAEANGPLAMEVRKAVNDLLSAEMEKAVTILTENRKKLDALVTALLKTQRLTGHEIDEILTGA